MAANQGQTYTFFKKLALLLKIQQQKKGSTHTFFMKIVSLQKNPPGSQKVTCDILAGSYFPKKMYRLDFLKRQFTLAGDDFLRKMYRSRGEARKMYRSEHAPTSFGARYLQRMYRSEHAPTSFGARYLQRMYRSEHAPTGYGPLASKNKFVSACHYVD